jgi:hypothetical protein
LALLNSQGPAAERFQPRLHAAAAGCRERTLPALRHLAALATRGPWEGERCRIFLADCELLERLALDLEAGAAPPPAQLQSAGRALRGIEAALEELQQRVEAKLTLPPIEFLSLLLALIAEAGLALQLDLEGDWRDGARLADPEDAGKLVGRLVHFHAVRLGKAGGRLLLRAWREPDHLLLASRDEATGPPPSEADLQRAGLTAPAARRHCGLRLREGEVQLSFAFVPGTAGRRRTRASPA